MADAPHTPVTDALIDKLSTLARLEFEGPARAQIKADLERMLSFVEQVQAVDTTGVEPLIHLTDELNDLEVIDTPQAHLRADEPAEPIAHSDALRGAPKADSDYFRVPKVVEKGE